MPFVASSVRSVLAIAVILGAGSVATAGGVAPACAPRVHRVASGETLSAIARSEGVSVATLVAAQASLRVRRNPSLIRTGQLVRLPNSSDLLSAWSQRRPPVESTWRAVRFELERLLSADGGRCVFGLVRESL